MDEQGCFYRRSEDMQAHADPEFVVKELEAQVTRAIQQGIVPTHIDTHMGSVAHPKFMMGYVQLAMQTGLPPMIFRLDEAGWQAAGLDAETAKLAAGLIQQVESMGVPLLDSLAAMPLDNDADRLEGTRQMLAGLKPGITHFIIHPSKDTPELRAITPDWRCRVADFQTFLDPGLKKYIEGIGIHIIGYRQLKELNAKKLIAAKTEEK